mmetsp:Transcript_31236/g.71425  ORF Transcript_31236/g.71425 Transcript_31236/m.71425 type:complete len:148 (+) Transcript_31236:917-1360(+)
MRKKTEMANDIGVDLFVDIDTINKKEDKEVLTLIDCPILAERIFTPNTFLLWTNVAEKPSTTPHPSPPQSIGPGTSLPGPNLTPSILTLEPSRTSDPVKKILRRPQIADQIINALSQNLLLLRRTYSPQPSPAPKRKSQGVCCSPAI